MTDTVSAPAPEFVPAPVAQSAAASAPPSPTDAAGAPARQNRSRRGGSGRNRGRGHGDNKAGQEGQDGKAGHSGEQGSARASAPRQNPQGARPVRAPRPVHPVLERLFALYPKMFGARFLPLKLGVFQDLLARHPDVFEKNELKIAMGLHARSMRYLESVAAGLPRHDLSGEPVEPVAPEHVHHAIMEVFRRRQERTKEDLRPYARAQLIQTIEASGLGREDYLLCIRAQDEVSVALLDEAFAELGAQAAKRDALRKTFEASGKSVAEFADMYGMDPDEVSHTLERSRASQAAQAVEAAPAAQTAQAIEMVEADEAVEAVEADQAPADASVQEAPLLPETNPADATAPMNSAGSSNDLNDSGKAH